jgi:hypothetical protein
MAEDEMKSSEQDNDQPEDKKTIVEQTVQGYSRQIELVRFVCRCPSCPYCNQEPGYEHINKMYCSNEAMLHHRQIQRKLEALRKGRKPGQVGRPRKDVDKQVLFVLRAGETDFYKVGFVEDIHQFESMHKAEQQAVPHGVDLVLKVDQPYCKEAVEVIYDVYSRYVGKGEWIELSESQIKEVRELLE